VAEWSPSGSPGAHTIFQGIDMNNFTRRAGARARLLAGVATVLACVLSSPTAQAELVARGFSWLDFSPETRQNLDLLGIRAGFDLSGIRPTWPSQFLFQGDYVHAVDDTPITISSAPAGGGGHLTMSAAFGEFDISFSNIDLITGVVNGYIITQQPDFRTVYSAYQPLLVAQSITGGGPLSTDHSVTVTLHDLAGSPGLYDMMAANLGRFGPQIQAQNLITLQQALRDMGDITVSYIAEVPFNVALVPEPANGLLMGLGLAALALARLCLRHAPPAFAARRLA
jgi:hypothetical protein